MDARFRRQMFELDLTVSPTDFGQISCEPNPVPFGGSSVCTAIPAKGFVLAEWTECAGEINSNQCRLSNVQGPVAIGLRVEEEQQDPPIPVPVNNIWLLLLLSLLTLGIAAPRLRRQSLRT